jgi:hypothetical protein
VYDALLFHSRKGHSSVQWVKMASSQPACPPASSFASAAASIFSLRAASAYWAATRHVPDGWLLRYLHADGTPLCSNVVYCFMHRTVLAILAPENLVGQPTCILLCPCSCQNFLLASAPSLLSSRSTQPAHPATPPSSPKRAGVCSHPQRCSQGAMLLPVL